MAGLAQLRGMLLEEVILCFLEANGYTPITATTADDLTLLDGPAGLRVQGRGSDHQIDAIANYLFAPPFSHPYRLLIEAKSINKPVGIEVIRNALGVLRDVAEFWVSREQPRFHYQYAVFADTRFTKQAESYGYVQDIFLLPLEKSHSMARVLTALHAIHVEDVPPLKGRRALHDLRMSFRSALRAEQAPATNLTFAAPLLAAAQNVGQALIGMTLKGFPLFLVPSPDVNVATLPDTQSVQITWDDQSWYIEDASAVRLFSFDLPEHLFKIYAKKTGVLTERRALRLKVEALSEIQATVFAGAQARLVRFLLDLQWVDQVRAQLEQRKRQHRAET